MAEAAKDKLHVRFGNAIATGAGHAARHGRNALAYGEKLGVDEKLHKAVVGTGMAIVRHGHRQTRRLVTEAIPNRTTGAVLHGLETFGSQLADNVQKLRQVDKVLGHTIGPFVAVGHAGLVGANHTIHHVIRGETPAESAARPPLTDRVVGHVVKRFRKAA